MRACSLASSMVLVAALACSSSGGGVDTGSLDAIDPGGSDAGAGDGAVDPAPESVSPDVDWDALPRLPSGKTFTTRYAAGAAERKVTPDHSIYMGGFGFCQSAPDLCRKSEGVHDDLWVSAVAIADTQSGQAVVLAGIDAIGILLYDHDLMQRMLRDALYEKYGVYFDGTAMMLSSSHSHGAPDACGLWGLGFGEGRDEQYIDFLRRQVVDAAVEAFDNLADVQISWGKDELESSSGDKDNHDYDLYVIQGKTPAGQVVFTLTRWSAHPTAYGSDNRGLSADWVGTFRAQMKKDIPGIHVYMQGPIGDVYPNRPTECGLQEEMFPDGYKTPGLSPESYMKVTCTGLTVVDAAKRALGKLKPLAETGIKSRYARFTFHPENGVLMLLANATPLPLPVVDVSDPNSLLETAYGWMTIGDLNFLSTPGESFPTYAKLVADEVRKTGAENVVTLGLVHDWMGYLLTPEQYVDPLYSYNQTLCPGGQLLPEHLESLAKMIAAE